MLRIWHRKNIYYYLGYSIIVMDSSSKFFFSFSINYAMIVKLVDLIVLLGSKLLNRFRKFFNNILVSEPSLIEIQLPI